MKVKKEGWAAHSGNFGPHGSPQQAYLRPYNGRHALIYVTDVNTFDSPNKTEDLEMKKLHCREVDHLSQGNTGSRKQSQDWNWDSGPNLHS